MPDYITLNNIFLWLGLIGTLLYVIKTIMFMFGGGDMEVETDFDSMSDTDTSFHFISLQAILAFCMGFGWAGLAAHVNFGLSGIISIIIAFVSGLLFMLFNAYLFYAVKKLDHVVKVDLKELVGKTGNAYTSFEANGNGQIQIEINKRLSIYDAINISDVKINSFEVIKVTKIEDNKIYIEKGE